MARGGARSGRPGATYPNRSDMQTAPRLAPQANVGQPYGTATAQLDSQSAVPMGPPPIGLSAPTTRPNEPIQAGLSTGPGPGPEVLTQSPSPDPVVAQIRALYSLYPTRELAEILEDIDNGITF